MPFRANLKVCFSDIDYAGIVYYPRFLHYFHVALEEFFSSEMGMDYPTVLKNYRLGLPTVHLETDFKQPLHYGDRIGVDVTIIEIGNTSITWEYTVYKLEEQESLVVKGRNITVCLNIDTYKKMEMPDWLRRDLTAYKERQSL